MRAIACAYRPAVVIRRSEQVPDNRLRKVVKIFYNLVALTLCDCEHSDDAADFAWPGNGLSVTVTSG